MINNPYVIKKRISKTSIWQDNRPILCDLTVELTERCNNDCIHCYINAPTNELNAKQKELSSDEIKEILKEAVSLGCITVRFTGGEPLLRDDFEEIYVFARKSGLKVGIFTNATLITPRLARLFAYIPPLQKIEVSIYGMKRDSYESVTRSPGSFEDAWKGINLLLEHKIPFILNGVFFPWNKDEIEEFETWASTIPWMDGPPAYSVYFDLHCRRDEEKNRVIRRLRLSKGEVLERLIHRDNKCSELMKEFYLKFTRPPGDKLFFCDIGLGEGCVDAYGCFLPCIMLRHPNTTYDLRKGSLKDALTVFFPKVRQFKASSPLYYKRCARCFLRGFCEQCPAKSWMEHGDLDTPVNYFCEIAHAQAVFFGLLKEGELAWEVEDWRERIKLFVDRDSKDLIGSR